ncbi:MAG TPA: hypothetical protein DFS52_26015 [Myxococcales bacterium]|jgi:hypothetical protein|nr:hypothetical protein [Myxococcales bacterium]
MLTAILLVSLLLPASALAKGAFGYARASSQLEHDSRPARYQPLNMVDGRAATSWCEGARGDGVGQRIVVGFQAPVSIDEVRVTNGEASSRQAFKANNRVRVLTLSNELARHTVTLSDTQRPQEIKLGKPLEGERFVVEIQEVFRGEGEANATCLTDVVFVSGGKPLSGPSLAGKLGDRNGAVALMGSWYSGLEGAPERFLDLYFDKTFRYRYQPFDPEEPGEEIRGEFAFDGKQLRLKPSGKEWVEASAALKAEESKDGLPRARLVIAAERLDGSLARSWSDRP